MNQPHPRIHAPNPPADLEEERELRAVTALLRGLPDPEPPSGLADRVLERIARYEARPRIVRSFLDRLPVPGRLPVPEPALATALAAGIACLLLFSSVQSGLLAPHPDGENSLRPTVARRVSDATLADTDAMRPRRPVVPSFVSAAVIDASSTAFLAPPAIAPAMPIAPLPGDQPTSPLDRRLDRQLNHLLLDPGSFYQRLDRVRDADQFVARLAERAARRGDATEIALELRQRVPHHVHTSWVMERMLAAVLAQHASNR